MEALGKCTFYPRCDESEVVPRSREADVILTNKVSITAAHMNALPKLRYIGVTATGYNIVDIEAARSRKLIVTNVPAYG